jgi:hypothetical protein
MTANRQDYIIDSGDSFHLAPNEKKIFTRLKLKMENECEDVLTRVCRRGFLTTTLATIPSVSFFSQQVKAASEPCTRCDDSDNSCSENTCTSNVCTFDTCTSNTCTSNTCDRNTCTSDTCDPDTCHVDHCDEDKCNPDTCYFNLCGTDTDCGFWDISCIWPANQSQ